MMYPVTLDQSRQQEQVNQHSIQLHMHHLCCPCYSPFYPQGFRPPFIAAPSPFIQPIPRPQLHHYQYNPLNYQSPPAELTFVPPSRDRRSTDGAEGGEAEKMKGDGNFECVDVNPKQVTTLTAEGYVNYLVNGCLIGEKIAKRNEHRPCFKNIQNLCNRTRSEVVKPNITFSNIHSQGVPWATKDFIFAFVRAVNCWCILRGYMGNNESGLGKIDKEISPEFRACYAQWELYTKEMTFHLIDTFCKLDDSNNPNTSSHQQLNSLAPLLKQPRSTFLPDSSEDKKIPGILHIHDGTQMHDGAAAAAVVETRNSESTEGSPREEDSDHEGSRVYMKPGSYCVPKKPNQSTPSTNNSNSSIELLNSVKNANKLCRKFGDKYSVCNSETIKDIWRTAQDVTPEFIKQNEESVSSVKDDQMKNIEIWLNTSQFDAHQDLSGEMTKTYTKPVTLLQRMKTETSSSGYGSTTTQDTKIMKMERDIGKAYPTFRKSPQICWEYKSGGINDSAISIFQDAINNLERSEFAIYLAVSTPNTRNQEEEYKNPTSLSTISKKLKNTDYRYLNEVIHDFRHIMKSCEEYYKDRDSLSKVVYFRNQFEDLIASRFFTADFTGVTGDVSEVCGPVVMKSFEEKTIREGEGEHP